MNAVDEGACEQAYREHATWSRLAVKLTAKVPAKGRLEREVDEQRDPDHDQHDRNHDDEHSSDEYRKGFSAFAFVRDFAQVLDLVLRSAYRVRRVRLVRATLWLLAAGHAPQACFG